MLHRNIYIQGVTKVTQHNLLLVIYLIFTYIQSTSYFSWSDKAVFKLNCHINRHNSIYWSSEIPHVTTEKEFNLLGVTINIWCGILSG